MKKAINVWSFPPEWTLERKLQVAREAGFEGFEIDLTDDRNAPLHLDSTSEEVAAVRSLIERHELEISGLATGLYWGANAASADESQRRRAGEILQRQIEIAAELGVDTILVVPGAVGVDFIPGSEVVPYAAAWDRAREFIIPFLELADQHQVQIAIENVWNKFLLSPREMRDFIGSFTSQWVGSYFDVGNAVASGYPEHWIDILAEQIMRVHFKDFRRAVGTIHGFVDLLSGDVNWLEVMRALRRVHFSGWVAAEMIPPVPFYKHCPEALIHSTSAAMDRIFALA